MRPALAIVVVVVVVAACGGPPAAPTHLPPPPRATERDPDLARMPDDIWAVAAVDLAQLRASTHRRWVWELLADHSPIARRCRDELAAGTRVTVGLRDRERAHYSTAQFAIVHGIDRAALTACLHQPLHDLPELPPSRDACDPFDAAVHALAVCGSVPSSHAAELSAFIERLGTEGAAACPSAAHAVEAANARRAALGWTCRREKRDRLLDRVDGEVRDVDRDTVALGDYERVRFLDDHTIEIGNAEAVSGAPAGILAELAPSAKAHWFEASAASLDRTHGAWFVADLRTLLKEPVAVAGALTLSGDLSIDLQIANASGKLTGEAITLTERALADPIATGVRIELGCSPLVTPARTPKFLACEAAEDHLATLEKTASVDVKGLLDYRAERCAADGWPDDYVGCLAAAATERDFDRCYQQLAASDRTRVDAGQDSSCGARAFHVHVTVPDKRIESLKLRAATDHEWRGDCRTPSTAPPRALTIGKGEEDRLYARVCFDDDCPLVAIDERPGPDDARWLDHGYTVPEIRCVGPFAASAPDFALASPNGLCDRPLSMIDELAPRPMINVSFPKSGVAVCVGGACTTLPRPDALAIAADGKLAAVRLGRSVETWDLAGRKRIARFPVAATCADLAFAGPLVAIGCGAGSYLATTTGARAAALGDALLSPLREDASHWAFVSRTGETYVAYDTATGKEQRRIAIPRSAAPGMVAVAGDGDGRIAIAYGGSGKDSGAVAVVDRAGVRSYQLSACPALPLPDH